MVNWRDPTTVNADELTLIKFVHVAGGIYIWEIVSCFGFEYSVITKKRKFTWSFLLYLGCRWFPLFTITIQFLGFDVSHEIDCQAWVIFTFMSAYLSFMCASALIILRVAVLWNRNKIATAFACTVWVCNTAVCAYSLTSFHGGWKTPPETTSNLCAVLDTVHGRISVLSTFTTDLILLVLMLTGLKRWKHAPKTRGIWRLLCNQGLIWVMIVTLAEVPPTVFILLNLNDPLNLIFQASALIVTAVGAARIYRGLVDYPAFDSSAKMVNEPHDALASPISHQTYQAKKQHDAEGRSVVLGTLPVKTSGGSEVPRGETFEGGNVV